MKPETKEEWIDRLSSLEKLRTQHEEVLRMRIAEGKSDHAIEQAGAAIVDCAKQINAAKKAIANFG